MILFRVTAALTAFTMGFVAVGPAAAQGTLLWQQNLNGTAVNSSDGARSVAVDNRGDVVVAGSTQNTANSLDFTVAKFDRSGTLLWQQILNGTAVNSIDQAFSVVVDDQGDVVVAGSIDNPGTREDFTVVKFDRNGTLLWQQNLHGNSFDLALAVAVDNRGNVVAAGSTGGATTGVDFTVAKFDGNGILLWQQTFRKNGFDRALSVAVDNQGNVVAAGFTENAGTGDDFTVVRFDGNGTLLWQQTLNGTFLPGADRAASVGVDNRGDVVVAGTTQNVINDTDFLVAKFDGNGTLLWQQTHDATRFNSIDLVFSAAVDNRGDVVVAGSTQDTETSDFTVAKFDRDGTLLWQQTLSGTAGTSDFALSVAVDNRGDVVAAGRTLNAGTGSDFTVAKFDR